MTIRSLAISAAATLGLIGAPAFAQESPTHQAGHNLYSEHCMVCHGVRGAGDGPLAEELRTPPADLTRIAERRNGVFPDTAIREIIDGRRRARGHGTGAMPLWGREFGYRAEAGAAHEAVIRDRISSLVAYLRSIQDIPTSTPPAKK